MLLPLADYVLDIHSGGKTLDFLPFAACHRLDDSKQQARCRAARDAFQAPYQVMMLDIDAESMYDTQVENMGKVFVTTELGGGGTTTPRTVAIAKRGVDNFLIHSGIMAGELLGLALITIFEPTNPYLNSHAGFCLQKKQPT